MLEALGFQILATIIGACIGSFLNVVIYRIPAGLSLINPPSRCPKCLNRLRPVDNIPILGWFLIKGKCRSCSQPVSWRYPLIETLTAFGFWLVAFNYPKDSYLVLGYSLFLSCLIALAVIDIDTMTLPNPITQFGLSLGLGFHALFFIVKPPQPWFEQILIGITGAVVGLWLLDLIRLSSYWVLQKEAMGAGDAKLAAMIGAWLGWQKVLLTLLIAAILGSIAGLIMLKFRSKQEKLFPFGPFLAIAALVSALWGDQIISAYAEWLAVI